MATMSSAAATTSYIDNVASTIQSPGHDVPPTRLAMRETDLVPRAGFLMLVPPQEPRYLLVPSELGRELRVHDLLQPDGSGVAVVHGDKIYVWCAAASADGESIFLGCKEPGGLRVYDTAQLLEVAARLLEGGQTKAGKEIVPRAKYEPDHTQDMRDQIDVCDAAFSHDATRLFVLWKTASNITVHDPSQPELPLLRKLDFSGGNCQYGNYQLACARGLLAACAGGSYGSPPPSSSEEAWKQRQVTLWRVDKDREDRLCMVSNPDLADAVAIAPDGRLFAVGLRNGVVRVMSPMSSDDTRRLEQAVSMELEPVVEVTGDPMVIALCFSHDGARLVAGRSGSDDFVVYDVSSATVVARFVQPQSVGYVAAFLPACDVLVTGGYNTQPCVFHRLLGPAPRIDLTVSDSAGIITSSDIVSHNDHGAVVAMACGSRLEVRTEDGKVLLPEQDLGEQLFTSLSKFRTAVRLHPGLKSVACVLAKKAVVVLSMADGSELLRVDHGKSSDTDGNPHTGGSCFGLFWSPDGTLLAVLTFKGAWMFSAAAGFAEVQNLEAGANVLRCAFDSTGARVAMAHDGHSAGGCVTVWDVATWTRIRNFQFSYLITTVCFSHNGARLAYCENNGNQVGLLSLEADSDDEPQLVATQVNALTDLKFSPDDNFLLCCPADYAKFDPHRMRVLDLATGTDAAWGELLRTMALPVTGGVLHGRSLGWAQLPSTQSLTRDASGNALQWVLYGAVGRRFVAVDIQAARYAAHDNAWTVDQLTFCVAHQRKLIGSVVQTAPHCSNIRDTDIGETVLHRLVRKHSVDEIVKWLEKCAHVTPVANAQGQTALQVAMQLERADVAQALWSRLAPSATSISALLVMRELRSLSSTHPHLVRPFLLDIEPKVVRTLTMFRTELTRSAEVCGLPTATLPGSSSDGATTFEVENAIDRIPSIWADKCPAGSPKMLVASKVVVLPNCAGDADSSGFHAIVTHCDVSVFGSKLLQLIVQHKWEENVRSQRMMSIALYAFAFMMAALAMVTSTSLADSSNTDDDRRPFILGLHGLVVFIEVSSLVVEAFQLARERCATYFSGPWNVLDVMSSCLLLFGSGYHLHLQSVAPIGKVQTAAALGIAMKCFGMVDYLRSWPATGSLVRMISVILADMVPFMAILSCAIVGCMLFFTINRSSEPDELFAEQNMFGMLVTVYHMTLGIGGGAELKYASPTTKVLVTLFTSFVVVVLLNLLIAIMGDSYQKVKESEHLEGIRERARIIVQQEKRFPKLQRYHPFMHFVEVVDSAKRFDERVWEGVTKRVSQMMSLEVGRLEENQHRLERNQLEAQHELRQELDCKMIELNGKMDTKFEKMDRKLDLVQLQLETILDRLK